MRTIAIGLLALGLAACLTPPDNDVVQWSDDFEACDLCGWTTVGPVSRVTTYHPGEHALAIGVGGRATHPIAITRNVNRPGDTFNITDGNWVELSTDCDGPGALAVRTVEQPGRFALDLVLDDRAVAGFERHYLNLPALPVVADPPAQTIAFVELTVSGGRVPCRVDNLQLRISGGVRGY